MFLKNIKTIIYLKLSTFLKVFKNLHFNYSLIIFNQNL